MNTEQQDLLASFSYKLGALKSLAELTMEAQGNVVPSALPMNLPVAYYVEDLVIEFERLRNELTAWAKPRGWPARAFRIGTQVGTKPTGVGWRAGAGQGISARDSGAYRRLPGAVCGLISVRSVVRLYPGPLQ